MPESTLAILHKVICYIYLMRKCVSELALHLVVQLYFITGVSLLEYSRPAYLSSLRLTIIEKEQLLRQTEHLLLIF